ncbi:HTH-type transcriptional regulator mcbR [Enterobacter ludwigii]|nr:HTH-type transcriptional regulator mcbR [Enterobacter ludwigii]
MLDLDHLEKAQRISLTMQVELSLKGALITGSLKPGARLITKEIADKLGTSITEKKSSSISLAWIWQTKLR